MINVKNYLHNNNSEQTLFLITLFSKVYIAVGTLLTALFGKSALVFAGLGARLAPGFLRFLLSSLIRLRATTLAMSHLLSGSLDSGSLLLDGLEELLDAVLRSGSGLRATGLGSGGRGNSADIHSLELLEGTVEGTNHGVACFREFATGHAVVTTGFRGGPLLGVRPLFTRLLTALFATLLATTMGLAGLGGGPLLGRRPTLGLGSLRIRFASTKMNFE